MPLGTGYWYDRLNRRYLLIDDHAQDVCRNPQRFRLTAVDLQRAILRGDQKPHTCQGHVVVNNEDVRALIIQRTAVAGYIRIRQWKGHLGWEFAGDPEDALKVLRRYIKSKEIGNTTLITFTDFGMGVSLTERAFQFGKGLHKSPVKDLIDRWIRRYERPDQPQYPGR
jgi:hypothetical protein